MPRESSSADRSAPDNALLLHINSVRLIPSCFETDMVAASAKRSTDRQNEDYPASCRTLAADNRNGRVVALCLRRAIVPCLFQDWGIW